MCSLGGFSEILGVKFCVNFWGVLGEKFLGLVCHSDPERSEGEESKKFAKFREFLSFFSLKFRAEKSQLEFLPHFKQKSFYFRLFYKKVLILSHNLVILSFRKKAKNLFLRYFASLSMTNFFRKELYFKSNPQKNSKSLNFLEFFSFLRAKNSQNFYNFYQKRLGYA